MIANDIHALLGEYPTGTSVPGNRVSKHRAGRASKPTEEQLRKGPRDAHRAWQARKSACMDAEILTNREPEA